MEAAVGHVAGAHEGRAAQNRQEERVGVFEDELNRRLVNLLDPPLLAVDGEGGVRGGDEVLVLVDVLVPEDEVVGGKGRAVGPLVALPQLDGEDAVVVAELPTLSQRRAELGAGVVPEDELVAGDVAVAVLIVARSGEATAQRAAVGADALDGLHDQRFQRHPLLDRRQRAVLDQRVQHRGLLEVLGPRGVHQHDRALELADQRAAERRILGSRGRTVPVECSSGGGQGQSDGCRTLHQATARDALSATSRMSRSASRVSGRVIANSLLRLRA